MPAICTASPLKNENPAEQGAEFLQIHSTFHAVRLSACSLLVPASLFTPHLTRKPFEARLVFILCLHGTGVIFPGAPTTAAVYIFTIVVKKGSHTPRNKGRGKKCG